MLKSYSKEKEAYKSKWENWRKRDILGIDNNGFIVKEGRLLVPAGLWQTYLKRVLAMHQQTEKMEARAQKLIWWPFMNRDIKNIAKTCLPCQEKLPSQAPEPERAHEEAYYPFHSLHMDLCTVIDQFSMISARNGPSNTLNPVLTTHNWMG